MMRPHSAASAPSGRRIMIDIGYLPARGNSYHRRDSRTSGEEPLLVEPVVEVGDGFAVAVPFERRPPLVGAEHPLARLAPARMRDIRVDVRPEPVLAALDGFPERDRALFGKREADDRFDRFEPVFPGQYQPQRRPVLLGNG